MNLAPCPRCNRVPDDKEIRETHLPPRMSGPGALISVQITHHCLFAPGLPYIVTSVRGRDHAQCEEGWNRRA